MKNRFGNHKKLKCRSTTLNVKMIRNYEKNFEKSKTAMEYQNLHRKLSEQNYQNPHNPNGKRCLLRLYICNICITFIYLHVCIYIYTNLLVNAIGRLPIIGAEIARIRKRV